MLNLKFHNLQILLKLNCFNYSADICSTYPFSHLFTGYFNYPLVAHNTRARKHKNIYGKKRLQCMLFTCFPCNAVTRRANKTQAHTATTATTTTAQAVTIKHTHTRTQTKWTRTMSSIALELHCNMLRSNMLELCPAATGGCCLSHNVNTTRQQANN